MAIEARQMSSQEGEQRPLGYLVLNGELIRGPFSYAITDGNEVMVNGRRVYPRVSRFPSDPTDDYEIENIKMEATRRLERIGEVSFRGILHEAGEDVRLGILKLRDQTIDLAQRERAFDALVSINTALEGGTSCIIMEGVGSETRFRDWDGRTQDRIREILKADLPDEEKAMQIDRTVWQVGGIGSAVVVNAASWM